MAEPITNVLGVVGMKTRGAYNSETSYEKLNVVTYQGSSYCAKTSTQGNLPTNTNFWDLIAEKGDKGDTGDDGYTPVKGTDYYTNADKAELESTLSDDVHSEVSTQLGNLTSATPLVASSTAGMTDTTRVYVNTTDGNWYWYNGSAWTDGGVYQAIGLADESVKPKHFSEFIDISSYEGVTVLANSRISGYVPGTHKVNTFTADGWTTYKIDLSNLNNVIKFAEEYIVSGTPGSHYICCLTKSDDYFLVGFGYSSNSKIKGVTYATTNTKLLANVDTIKSIYETAKYMYICMFNGYKVNIISNSKIGLPLWFGINNAMLESNIIGPEQLRSWLDVNLYQNNYTLLENTRINGYVPGTHKTNIFEDQDWNTYKIDMNGLSNYLKFAEEYIVSGTPGSHDIFGLATADNDYIISFGSNYNSNITGVTYTTTNKQLVADITSIKENYPTARYIYICMRYEASVDILCNSKINTPLWFGVDSNNLEINNIKSDIDKINYIDLDVMPRITAVVGHELNFYKDSILHTNNNEQYYLSLSIPSLNGTYITLNNYGSVIRINPVAQDIGERTCTFKVYNKTDQRLLASKTFILDIVADSCPTTRAIFIGDSLTENGIYIAEITKNLNTNIESIGTITKEVALNGQTYTIKHEGRAGWSIHDYLTKAENKGQTNSFFNPTSEKFDFSYYMSENNFSNVNMVLINLGTNGYGTINDEIDGLQEMITSIHAYDSNIKIILGLINLGALQSGWGTRGSASSSAFNYRVRQLHKAVVENLITTNVYISSPYVNLDSYHDFSTIQVPASSRNPELITIENNTSHPSTYGYLKFADSYYNEIVYYMNN